MTTSAKLLSFAALAISATASGCLYQREAVREPPPVVQSAPPPPTTQPPPMDSDSNVAPPATAEGENVPPPGADVQDDSVFYERLAPYGHWEWVPEYGRVWVPAVAPGWRPYVYGRWVLTDWGWTWVSDDPWAWAAYHYGTWGFTVGIGWFWVPGHIWAPAWVTWRWGFGYCAWAPIGPRGFFWGYASPAWVAVRAEHFTQPISVHVVPVQRTSVIVQRTAPLAAPRAAPARGGSFGPPVAQVAAATGQTIRPVSAAAVIRPRATFTAPARPTASGSPARAQSPMQSPRSQPAQTTGTWRGASRATSTGSWRARTSSTVATRGWGAARVSNAPRTWGGAAPARGAAPSGGGVRAAPSAPRAAPSAPHGGGGGARASGGGHGRR